MSKPSTTEAPSKASDKKGLDRRRIFMMGGSVVAAAAIAPLATDAEASESQSERTKARYKETAHVKDFYRVNGY